jgi:hypothetical protein
MDNANWVMKLKVSFVDDDNGSTIHIEWDEHDPDLAWWSGLTDEERKQFFRGALDQYLTTLVD